MNQPFFNPRDWTLFLDRDGVLNQERKNDYIKTIDELIPKKDNLKGLAVMSSYFNKIIIVTNQKGISKKLYTEETLHAIHQKLIEHIHEYGGRVDKIYYSKAGRNDDYYRKPNPGMAYLAKENFPDIDFKKSVMIGDTFSDMLFGRNLKMTNILILSQISSEQNISENVYDYKFKNLLQLVENFNLS